ncbi:MAG: hypothetical protein FJW31_11920 [Acidobacteria bacterium]|nr:hypothetical protein [Acidobacteriota bacterium]
MRVNSGAYDAMLGRSYAQIARDGLRWQRSQGAGAVASRPGPQITFYKLLASRLATPLPKREDSFLDGLGEPAVNRGDLWKQLAAAHEAGADSRRIARLQEAVNKSWAIELEALVQPAQPITGMMAQFRPYETFTVATPGQAFDVALSFHSRLRDLRPARYELLAAAGWTVAEKSPGRFAVTVSDSAAPTAAFWTRDPVRDLTYALQDPTRFGQPLPATPLRARAYYRHEGVENFVEAIPLVSRIDTLGVQQLCPLVVGPALSTHFATEAGVLPLGRRRYALRAIVRNVASRAIGGTVKLELPAGWRSEPSEAPVLFQKEGEEAAVAFTAIAPLTASAADAVTATAVARAEGRAYRERFQPHTYTGLDTLYLLRPARHTIRRVDVKTAPGLRIGYIAGTGDDVPQTLAQLGVPYDLLDTAALATGNLRQYSAILLGIRAYAAREDVKTYNQRLLDYAARGGVVIVQYNTPEYDANDGPFPHSMGRNPEEVSEEDAPVTMLDPAYPVFGAPNRITAADFDGWIEQRGSKFFTTWDPRWKPLIETHDTGQAPQKGAWLVARHGRGLYVYCALAWYRQLPFAVPGVVRLFANLISQRPPATAAR